MGGLDADNAQEFALRRLHAHPLRQKRAGVNPPHRNKPRKSAVIHVVNHQPHFVHVRTKQQFFAAGAFFKHNQVAQRVGAHFVRMGSEQRFKVVPHRAFAAGNAGQSG